MKKNNDETSEEKSPSLEEAFLQIEDIITRMESEDVSLDESFTLYQEGIGKLKDCTRMLDEVEKKMLVLNEEGALEEMS